MFKEFLNEDLQYIIIKHKIGFYIFNIPEQCDTVLTR